MLDKIKEEIQQPYYIQNFPNEGQRFVAWYLRNIHLKDMNETRDCITDGQDDKQIDAVVIDDDKSTVYVIQGKFIGAPRIDAEPLRGVLASWVQLKDLVRLQEVANHKLRRKLSEVSNAFEEDYHLSFELITTSALTDVAKKDLSTFQEELQRAEDLNATLHLVDIDELQRRYNLSLDRDNPSITWSVKLEDRKYIEMNLDGTRAIIAIVPLKDCLSIPGIKDGSLFQKNVRQSLGLSNRVNKGMQQTIYATHHSDFVFMHNGITAICNKLILKDSGQLELRGLSVVNGCQSLNTILSCSEKVKTIENTFIMFRFYEIPQIDRADRISIATNTQSAVKPRDLRSNDPRVRTLKRIFEQKYPNGYLQTKRGESAPAERDQKFVVDLSDLGKYLISWHSQRPNVAYGETKIFDKYFEQLFRRPAEYKPERILALQNWMHSIKEVWNPSNPLGLNESLLAMRAYAPFHQLYAIGK